MRIWICNSELLLNMNISIVDRVHYHVIGISLVMSMRWFISYWWNDYYVEYIIGITILEQESLLVGFQLFILSEWMLFVGGFGAQLNWMFNMNVLYSLNLLNYFTFSLAFSNLLILIFSSFSIQSCIIYHCYGYVGPLIECLGQTVSIGYIFLIVQLKEFLYSYYSVSDGMIGSIFYLTVTLHGSHVFIGLFWLYMLWFLYYYFDSNTSYTEYSLDLLCSSLYWHFVDAIWLIVFLLYYL